MLVRPRHIFVLGKKGLFFISKTPRKKNRDGFPYKGLGVLVLVRTKTSGCGIIIINYLFGVLGGLQSVAPAAQPHRGGTNIPSRDHSPEGRLHHHVGLPEANYKP